MRARGLIRAAHLGPSLAITVMIVLLATTGSPSIATLTVFAVAAFAGEISIGWSNDAADAPADAIAQRVDKPIVGGLVSRRSVIVAAVVALLVGAVLSFVVHWSTGVINLVMVGAGWAYNLGLKATPLSGLMYLIGFGLIPAYAASATPGHPWPPAWATAAAALLGLGGHFANVLPDLAVDRVSGVRGLPQRIAALPGGGAIVRLTALLLLLGASVLIVVAPAGAAHWYHLAGLGLAAALAVVGLLSSGRTPFRAAIAIAGLDVVLLLTRGQLF